MQNPNFWPKKGHLICKGVLEYKYNTHNPHYNFGVFVQWQSP